MVELQGRRVGRIDAPRLDRDCGPAARRRGVPATAEIWERPLKPDRSPVDEWKLPIDQCEESLRELFRLVVLRGAAYVPKAEGIAMIEWC